MTLLLFYLFLALFVSFLCSILEAVLLSITPSYIESLQDNDEEQNKNTFPAVLANLKLNIDQSISSILILNTIAHTMGAVGVGAEAVRVFGIQWQSLIAVVMTLLILYISEIIPKTIGATYWRELAKPSAYIILFLIKILYPLIWISQLITKSIRHKKKQGPTREEISALAEIGEKYGTIEEKESQLISNLLQLKDFRVKDIITPRGVVFALNSEQTLESVLKQENIFIYSRIPIYQENVNNVIGMVFARKVLKALSNDDNDTKLLSSLVEPVFTVSENMPVYYLMNLFIQRKEHLFIVHDSFEQYMGIVTLEDAIETLLGVEIVDEADLVADMQELAREKAFRWKQQAKKTS